MWRRLLFPRRPRRQVLVQPTLESARAEHPGGVAVHQHLDHHGGVEGLVARAAARVARVERAQVQRADLAEPLPASHTHVSIWVYPYGEA